MSTDVLVGLTTVESEQQAKDMAAELVKAHIAACVQISGPVQSVYEWKNQVCHDAEWQLWIKLSKRAVPALKRWTEINHPYEEPELLFLPAVDGQAGYLSWVVTQSTGADA